MLGIKVRTEYPLQLTFKGNLLLRDFCFMHSGILRGRGEVVVHPALRERILDERDEPSEQLGVMCCVSETMPGGACKKRLSFLGLPSGQSKGRPERERLWGKSTIPSWPGWFLPNRGLL